MKEKIRIEAIVQHKSDWGTYNYYVLNRPLQMAYTKIDPDSIIGEDEGVLLFYEKLGGKDAFGGREFTLNLTDGSVENCSGQWWDFRSESARLLYPDEAICNFAHSTKDDLNKCYVFYGAKCEKQWLDNLVSEYQGKIYEYWEYEKMIKKYGKRNQI